jgi:hypothetical protein
LLYVTNKVRNFGREDERRNEMCKSLEDEFVMYAMRVERTTIHQEHGLLTDLIIFISSPSSIDTIHIHTLHTI